MGTYCGLLTKPAPTKRSLTKGAAQTVRELEHTSCKHLCRNIQSVPTIIGFGTRFSMCCEAQIFGSSKTTTKAGKTNDPNKQCRIRITKRSAFTSSTEQPEPSQDKRTPHQYKAKTDAAVNIWHYEAKPMFYNLTRENRNVKTCRCGPLLTFQWSTFREYDFLLREDLGIRITATLRENHLLFGEDLSTRITTAKSLALRLRERRCPLRTV